jgi:uncharacterized membrane protein
MSATHVARGAIVALFGLILAWHLVLAPPASLPRWLAVALHASPLLPALALLLLRRPSAPFWGALAALILICHGVSEAWIAPGTRARAAAEIVLCLVLVFAASWNGLRARMRRRVERPNA